VFGWLLLYVVVCFFLRQEFMHLAELGQKKKALFSAMKDVMEESKSRLKAIKTVATAKHEDADGGPDSVKHAMDPVFQLEKIGIKAGVYVKLKKRKADTEPQMFFLVSITQHKAYLRSEADGSAPLATVQLASLISEYIVCVKSTPISSIGDWSSNSPCNSVEWGVDLVKMAITRGLCEQMQTHLRNASVLTIMTDRTVCASEAIPKQELVLVPATRKILTRKPEAKVGATDVDLGAVKLPTCSDVVLFTLGSQYQPNAEKPSPWVAPFWLVHASTCNDKSRANMQYEKKQITYKIGKLAVQFELVLLVNTKNISADTELMVFAEKDKAPDAGASEAVGTEVAPQVQSGSGGRGGRAASAKGKAS
jgi:hypothetical protein